MEIGELIRNARTGAGFSQEQAAEALGVSRQTVSNWETGKTYPDILSVIRMSDLYSVSLDHLLKEERSVKQTYKEYLEESTNVVRSNERKSQTILISTVLAIWALALIAFLLVQKGVDSVGFTLAVTWTVLPITFFTASFIIGRRDWFGKLKWLAIPVFSVMYTLTGLATSVTADNMVIKSVTWPDFAKLPIGLIISLAGILIGTLMNKRQRKDRTETNEERNDC